MTDPTHEQPPTLVERLRNTAINLTSTHVAVDANGDPIGERPLDGSEEDFDDPLDPVEFEPEALHDMAALYRKAADELEEAALLREQANAEIARLTEALGASAEPPNRAHLLGQLESWDRGVATLTTGELIRDAIAAIRTDARVIEASRTNLKAWHSWARKIGRAEGDEFAGAMPSTLQARISRQVEAGQLALLVEPIRRRVELALALCEDMGLGGPEAAELAPKAALWTDAEVAEIEAFRTKDWSGTNLNPFDHLPPALERTIYPGPGGRRAYLKRAGEPLPPEAPAPAERQLGLPGLPRPETAMRLRLALIDKPDGPLSALVAGFAQALLEKLDKAGIDRDNAHAWMEDGWADTLRRALREHVDKGDPRDVAAYSAFAWHHGWSLAQDRYAHLDQVDRDILAAKPEDRANVLLEGLQRHMEAAGATDSPEFFRQSPADRDRIYQAEQHHADLRYAMGHTTHKPTSAEVEQTHADLQRLASASQPSEGPDLVATCLWELLEAIEQTDPTDTQMSKAQFRGTIRGLARRRHDLMSEAAVRESGGRVLQLASPQ